MSSHQPTLVLEGPNRSMCISSHTLVVETHCFDLNDVFTCFPFWHASHNLSCWNLISGRLVIKFFETRLFRCAIWMCASLLCQIQGLSFLVNKHAIESKEVFSMSMMYMFWTLFPIKINSFDEAWQIKQWLTSNVTFKFLWHNWLMLKRLCLSPSTSSYPQFQQQRRFLLLYIIFYFYCCHYM